MPKGAQSIHQENFKGHTNMYSTNQSKKSATKAKKYEPRGDILEEHQ